MYYFLVHALTSFSCNLASSVFLTALSFHVFYWHYPPSLPSSLHFYNRNLSSLPMSTALPSLPSIHLCSLLTSSSPCPLLLYREIIRNWSLFPPGSISLFLPFHYLSIFSSSQSLLSFLISMYHFSLLLSFVQVPYSISLSLALFYLSLTWSTYCVFLFRLLFPLFFLLILRLFLSLFLLISFLPWLFFSS